MQSITNREGTMSQWTVMQRTPITRALASFYDATHAEFLLARMKREYPEDTFNIMRETHILDGATLCGDCHDIVPCECDRPLGETSP